MTETIAKVAFEDLPEDEKIILTTSAKLIKHFRGLESSGILDEPTTRNLIGCVKKLSSVARVRGADIIPVR